MFSIDRSRRLRRAPIRLRPWKLTGALAEVQLVQACSAGYFFSDLNKQSV